MTADIFAGKSKAEIAALIKEGQALLKQGILPTDKAVKDIAEQVAQVAKEANTSTDKVLAAVKLALGGKTGATGARTPSLRNVMKKKLDQKYGNDVNTSVIAKDFIAKHGQAAYDKLAAEYPSKTPAKKQ